MISKIQNSYNWQGDVWSGKISQLSESNFPSRMNRITNKIKMNEIRNDIINYKEHEAIKE